VSYTEPPVNDPNHPMNFWVNKEQLLSHNHLARLINTVQLVQDVGSTEKPITLTVLVSRFDAHSEDRTGYKWQDKNGDHVFEMPPFLISDVEGTQKRILQYASESTPYYLANLLDKSNPIIWSTFQLALRCKVCTFRMVNRFFVR